MNINYNAENDFLFPCGSLCSLTLSSFAVAYKTDRFDCNNNNQYCILQDQKHDFNSTCKPTPDLFWQREPEY